MKKVWFGGSIGKEAHAKTYARKFLEAQMDYGKGSRINRRNVNKEVEINRNDPEWNDIFMRELGDLDRDKVFQDLQRKKKLQSTYKQGKKGVRLFRKAKRLFYDLLEVLG